MDKVKALRDAGLPIPTAIKQALGMLLAEFADKYGFPRPVISDVLNGNRRPTSAHVDALIAELGGTREEWEELLWVAAIPAHVPWREALDWLANRVHHTEPIRATA